MKTKLALLSPWLLAAALCQAQSNVYNPGIITYQGVLNDGANPAEGNYDFQFNLYNTNSSGVPLVGGVSTAWHVTKGGLFTIPVDFGANVFNGANSNYWLDIGVRSNGTSAPFSILSPRQPLTAAPLAIYAQNAATLAGGVAMGSAAGNLIAIGVTGSFAGAGQSNDVQAADSSILGGTKNMIGAYADNASISGGMANQTTAPGSAIDGGEYNEIGMDLLGAITMCGYIGGGDWNSVNANYGVVAGGMYNLVEGMYAAALSGSNNVATDNGATVAGGIGNIANGFGSYVGGGFYNTAAETNIPSGGVAAPSIGGSSPSPLGLPIQQSPVDVFNSVGGGTYNTAYGKYSTISGGYNNQTTGTGATVAGGEDNWARANYATIGGGSNNIAYGPSATIGGGDLNQANGSEATVAGGTKNTAGGDDSAVGGGDNNSASAEGATVPGGEFNTASGIDSFAAGTKASASFDNSFVWSSGGPFSDAFGFYGANRSQQFKIQAGGGVEMDVSGSSGVNPAALFINSTSANGVGLYVLQTNSSDACIVINTDAALLSGQGDMIKGFGWSGNFGNPNTLVFEVTALGDVHAHSFNSDLVVTTSDRNAKENLKDISPTEVLQKVVSMPITEWNFKGDTEKEHIGPMAQDFHAAFGLDGSNDKGISTTDEGGVALAAIQGLNQELQEQLRQKDAAIRDLQSRLERLEKLMAKSAGKAENQ